MLARQTRNPLLPPYLAVRLGIEPSSFFVNSEAPTPCLLSDNKFWRRRWESNPPKSRRQRVTLPESYYGILVLSTGIDPASPPWKGSVLATRRRQCIWWWRMMESNHLTATLLNVSTGLQPATGNILLNTLTTGNYQSISKLCSLIKNVCIKTL